MSYPAKVSSGQKVLPEHINNIIDWVKGLIPRGDGKTTKVTSTQNSVTISSLGENSKLYPIMVVSDRGFDSRINRHVYSGFYYPDYSGDKFGKSKLCYLVPLATLTKEEWFEEEKDPGYSAEFPFRVQDGTQGEGDENTTDSDDYPGYGEEEVGIPPETISANCTADFTVNTMGQSFKVSLSVNVASPTASISYETSDPLNLKCSLELRYSSLEQNYYAICWVVVPGRGATWSYSTLLSNAGTNNTYIDMLYDNSTAIIQYNLTKTEGANPEFTLDSDGDGVPDWREILDGTDPEDATDFNPDYDPNNPTAGLDPDATETDTRIQNNDPAFIGDDTLYGQLCTPKLINYKPSRPYLSFDYPRWVKGSYCTNLHQEIIDLIP